MEDGCSSWNEGIVMGHVVEITRVAVEPGEEDAPVAGSPAVPRALARDRSGFRDAYLARLGAGDRPEPVLRDSPEDAGASYEKGPGHPGTGPLPGRATGPKSVGNTAVVVRVPGIEHPEPGRSPGTGS
ncbi:hypothetical protein [Streptomyces sp. CAU 1734]|uniref:hypothetical protein n=1 Tax=Streptomyces sp. CAU 1734 TaxID=3140360 RepID=UPI0032619D74